MFWRLHLHGSWRFSAQTGFETKQPFFRHGALRDPIPSSSEDGTAGVPRLCVAGRAQIRRVNSPVETANTTMPHCRATNINHHSSAKIIHWVLWHLCPCKCKYKYHKRGSLKMTLQEICKDKFQHLRLTHPHPCCCCCCCCCACCTCCCCTCCCCTCCCCNCCCLGWYGVQRRRHMLAGSKCNSRACGDLLNLFKVPWLDAGGY